MAYATYNNIGKGIIVDGNLMYNFYGADFNPTNFVFPSWNSVSSYQPTSNFDLTNFQPGHEVGCGVLSFAPEGWTGRVYGDFYRDGSYGRRTRWDVNDGSAAERCVYMYFGVDKDEIRPGYSNYYINYNSADGVINFTSPTFTASNLSIDSTLHRSGYMWISGNHLCYTDNTGDEIGQYGRGYKHRIAYDSSYSTSVGTDKAGYIRLDSSDLLRIYYVDENGYRRRTYPSDAWYRPNESYPDVNVGSDKSGYMRVGTGYAEYGYGHLCFIGPNGSKRRILNGPPVGYV